MEKLRRRLLLADVLLVLSLAAAITATFLLPTTLFSGYIALQPAGPAAQNTTSSVGSTTFSSTTQQGLQPQPLVLIQSLSQPFGYVALLSWVAFGAALIWRGHVRSVWGKSRFSYDTFRLLVRMRGAQTRLKLMRSLSEPKNKLQLATALGVDWKAVDKHVQKLEKSGVIQATATKGTATFYELTDKGVRLLQVLEELGADIGEQAQANE